ncbi:PREDICTED: uncharacterized protein LOC108561656 [Nicrophorus vespilloides]|uniref:Uncharacterized protein LOC108561656 n=1 Tax=Nicrophorus vespilloides TaxID=110193 RepID=A0ABM1MKS9_NICVS|nr:PREDICTED: uncharacterized protein LOC108561656 [Nicrophorus vespilloides]
MYDLVDNPRVLINTMNNLNGYPIAVSTFTRIPTNMPYATANNGYDCSYGNLIFGGLDGCVMKYMSKILNFELNIVEPLDKEKFGYKAPNGTFLGSLGDIVYRRAQITGNSRFLEVFDREQYEYTLPIKNDQICFVVPKADRIPPYASLFNCFSSDTWTALLIVMCSMCVLYYFSAQISFHLLLRTKMCPFKDTINIIGLFLNVPMHKLPQIHHERMIVISCLMFNIIILGTFQGSLFTSFSSILYYPDINTLEDLSHSNLFIATSLDPFNGDESQVIKKIYSKHIDLFERALTRAALKRDVAAMERKEDANFFIQTEYISSDGVPLLHVVAECPTSNFLAYIVPKHSPFLPRFNVLLRRFLESGLIEKWYYDTVEATILSNKYAKNQTSNSQEPLELQDLQSAFYFLFVGAALATIAFVIEITCKLFK